MNPADIEHVVRHILLVEDNSSDVALIREIITEIPHVQLHSVSDTIKAIHFLIKREGFDHAPDPDLIILDIRLPIFSGKTLLEERRRRQLHPLVPVVVLTTTSDERLDCMILGATEFHTKPSDWPQWLDLIQRMVARHLTVPTPW